MARLSAFACGLLFGLGLLLAGMANPAKVLAFLDLGGAWDPSLALVMAGAIAVDRIQGRGRRAASRSPRNAPPLTSARSGGSTGAASRHAAAATQPSRVRPRKSIIRA